MYCIYLTDHDHLLTIPKYCKKTICHIFRSDRIADNNIDLKCVKLFATYTSIENGNICLTIHHDIQYIELLKKRGFS